VDRFWPDGLLKIPLVEQARSWRGWLLARDAWTELFRNVKSEFNL
jgi:hypothetical protein